MLGADEVDDTFAGSVVVGCGVVVVVGASPHSAVCSCVASRSTMASGCTVMPSCASSLISLSDSVVLCRRKSENLTGPGNGDDVSCVLPKIMLVLPFGTSVYAHGNKM
eukprot:529137-Rhodomonas_salina.1